MRFFAIILATVIVLSIAPVAHAQPLTMPPLGFHSTENGIVRLPLSLFSNTNSTYLRVLRNGVEIPAQIANDTLQFIATTHNSRYTAASSYWIVADNRPGLRDTLATTMPLVWEHDDLYQSSVASSRGDHWFAGEIRGTTSTFQILLTMPGVVPAGTAVELSLASVLASDHRLRLSYAGTAIAVARWSDNSAGTQVRMLNIARDLPAGPLTLTLQLTSTDPDDMLLVDMLRMPDVRVPLPVLAQPILSPVSILSTTSGPTIGTAGADVIIVTTPALRASLAPLVRMHERGGDGVAVVDVQDIYNEFSFGVRDAESIRAYIRTAVKNWHPAPRLVLLVGTSTVRLRLDTQFEDTLLPPYLLTADPKYGEIACDTCYGRVSTTDVRDQAIPDLVVGRFPVRTPEEADILVAKTVQSLTSPVEGSWRARTLIVSDNDREADGTPDLAGSFSTLATHVASLLPPSYKTNQFIYAPDQAASAAPYYNEPTSLRSALFQQFDAGAALLTYVGHASLWQWSYTGPNAVTPYLVNLYDADSRTNAGRLPILVSLTCLSGNWANPTLQTVDERLVLRQGGGVVATLSPTGSGVNTAHQLLADGVFPALASRQSLGAAHLAGLRSIANVEQHHDLLFSYNILGHPDVVLPRPAYSTFLPLTIR